MINLLIGITLLLFALTMVNLRTIYTFPRSKTLTFIAYLKPNYKIFFALLLFILSMLFLVKESLWYVFISIAIWFLTNNFFAAKNSLTYLAITIFKLYKNMKVIYCEEDENSLVMLTAEAFYTLKKTSEEYNKFQLSKIRNLDIDNVIKLVDHIVILETDFSDPDISSKFLTRKEIDKREKLINKAYEKVFDSKPYKYL